MELMSPISPVFHAAVTVIIKHLQYLLYMVYLFNKQSVLEELTARRSCTGLVTVGPTKV